MHGRRATGVRARTVVVARPERVYLHGRMPADTHPTGFVEPVEPGWFWAVGEGFEGILIGCGEDAASGQVVISALLQSGSRRLSAATLRALPLGRLEAVLQREELRQWALDPAAADSPMALATRLRPGPSSSDFPSWVVEGPDDSDDRASTQSRVSHPGVVGLETTYQQLQRRFGPAAQTSGPRPVALVRPGPRVSDEFLQDVARKYRELAQRTHKPTAEIAQEAGVPVNTARRWVGAARARGFLGPGHRGRAAT